MIQYIDQLRERYEALRSTIPRLEDALCRLTSIERLDGLVTRLMATRVGNVVDIHAPCLLRPARVWAAIGPVGIPDQIDFISEANSFSAGFGEVQLPDLAGYRERGWMVMTVGELSEFVVRLLEDVMSGKVQLPYRPDPSSLPPNGDDQ
jgi:hypothetical protein